MVYCSPSSTGMLMKSMVRSGLSAMVGLPTFTLT